MQQLEQLVGKDDLGSHSDLSDELQSYDKDMSDMEDDMSTDEFDMLAQQQNQTEQQEEERHAQHAAKLYQQMHFQKSGESLPKSQDDVDVKDEEVNKYLDDEIDGKKKPRKENNHLVQMGLENRFYNQNQAPMMGIGQDVHMLQQHYSRPYDASNRGPRAPYSTETGNCIYKSEHQMIGQYPEVMLPFITKRVEKNNNNGVRKQARLEIRRRMVNERVKLRARIQSMRKMEAIKELISKGELPADSLKWKAQRCKTKEDPEVRAQRRALLKEQGIDIKSEDELDPFEDELMMGSKESKERNMPVRWSNAEHSTLIAMIKKKGKKWCEIAEVIQTKNEQQCRTRALIIFNKLKRFNSDPELFNVLSIPTRQGNEIVKGEYVRLPNGEVKRDKRGRAIRRRPPKPKPEVKEEEQEVKPSPKKKIKKERDPEDEASDNDDRRKDQTYRASVKKCTTPSERTTRQSEQLKILTPLPRKRDTKAQKKTLVVQDKRSTRTNTPATPVSSNLRVRPNAERDKKQKKEKQEKQEEQKKKRVEKELDQKQKMVKEIEQKQKKLTRKR